SSGLGSSMLIGWEILFQMVDDSSLLMHRFPSEETSSGLKTRSPKPFRCFRSISPPTTIFLHRKSGEQSFTSEMDATRKSPLERGTTEREDLATIITALLITFFVHS